MTLKRKLILTLLSSLLMSLPWIFASGVLAEIAVFASFVGFVPLLILQKETNGVKFTRYAIYSFVIFNLITISWVAKSAVIGVFAATLTYIVLFGVVMWLYNYVWKRAKKPLAYTILVTGWVAAERLYLNGEISFPWLNIGNSFAQNIYITQWIEYLGSTALTLWALVVNLLAFETISSPKETHRRYIIKTAAATLIPILVSVIIYFKYEEPKESITVSILQPNIDPYNEKFGGLSQIEQEDILVALLQQVPQESSYAIAPETALDNGFWVDRLSINSTINRIQSVIRNQNPNLSFVTGLTTLKAYPKTEFKEAPTVTAREMESFYYDIYNSAVQIDSSSETPLYHKSRLVIGVEMLPYHQYIPFINKLSVSLGGISGMLGSQEEASTFEKSSVNIKVGSAICYESIYGEYFSEFVRKGAQLMFIITNDGWWGDTFGYNQHLMFARLRAIENRRAIARSANTGISAFINPRGEIVKELGWDERGVITDKVQLNNEITFFTTYGDMTGRASTYAFVLSIFYYVAYRRRKKDHIVE